MAASTRKDHIFVLGIFKAPEHLSQTEFETQLVALADMFLALPVVQRCLLRWDTIRRTDGYDEHVQSLGFAKSEPTIIFKGVYKSYDHMIEIFQDAEVQNYFTGAAAPVLHPPTTCGFLAELTTWFEDRSRTNNVHTTAIFKTPAHLSKDQFQTQMQALISGLVALPATKTNLGKLDVCVQTEGTDVQSIGFSVPESTIVLHADAENWETMLEFTRDAEVQELLAQSGQKSSFHPESVWFSNEIKTKLDNSEGRS
ncbi:hypothetical protein K438DRAFT_1974371 [Mycena galopus ATCC 62051]|nr:hypothetical protein K438DRAFT_1974371 [Mycena galopus ATCC 62051]